MEITSEKRNISEAISVADFLAAINASLTSHSGRVEGEVTSVKKTYPTAVYFTIKDVEQNALLDCIIWRTAYAQNGVDIEVGDKIVVTGIPEIYAPRGSFSLKVRTIEYAGEGALKKEYDELKKKLTTDGLLTSERKRLLPEYPEKIGVITSRSGVVIEDFNSNLGRYGFKTTMVDSRVEGKDAIHEILAAIKTLAKQDIDVLVIMRGGGSRESLQAFNTESVVRAIAEFKCPVLTGIGHDVDVTLAELVADVGASTPTAVAEKLNESWDTLTSAIDSAEVKIVSGYKHVLTNASRMIESNSESISRHFERALAGIHKIISNKSESIQSSFRSIEKLIMRASTAFQSVVGVVKSQIRSEHKILTHASKSIPKYMRESVDGIQDSIALATRSIVTHQSDAIREVSKSYESVEKRIKLSDPSHNLKLGYSLSYINGTLVRSIQEVKVTDEIEVKLTDGSFASEIKNII
jgi:exodeoxyribonuclease VII large subunit